MEDLVFLTQEEVECQAVADQLIQKQPKSLEFERVLEPDEWIFSSNLEPPSRLDIMGKKVSDNSIEH